MSHSLQTCIRTNMQSFLNRVKNLSSTRPFAHPTTGDSLHIDPSLFRETRPTANGLSQSSKCPIVTGIVIKHSGAFNSERAAGMSKLQQLQFVEVLKEMIIGMSIYEFWKRNTLIGTI